LNVSREAGGRVGDGYYFGGKGGKKLNIKKSIHGCFGERILGGFRFEGGNFGKIVRGLIVLHAIWAFNNLLLGGQ